MWYIVRSSLDLVRRKMRSVKGLVADFWKEQDGGSYEEYVGRYDKARAVELLVIKNERTSHLTFYQTHSSGLQ